MSIPKYDSEANLRKKDQMVIRCLRTTGAFAPMPDDVVEFVYSWLEGPEKFATILMDKVHQWLLLDRYERRALWRFHHANAEPPCWVMRHPASSTSPREKISISQDRDRTVACSTIRGRGADERRTVRQQKSRQIVDALEPLLRAKLGLISQKSKLPKPSVTCRVGKA
jgi:hypothetical protein